MNIWDLAKQKLSENKQKAAELEQKLDDENGAAADTNYLSEVRRRHEAHIIIAGNRKSGKSSFQMNFVERKEDLKESVGLEYSYARRTRGNVKDVANLWELGGGHSVTELLSIPINAKTVEICSLIILLDMTKLDEMWTTIEKVTETVRKIIETLGRQDVSLQSRLTEKMNVRLEKYDANSLKMCTPCLLPVTIVASKYDEFQNFESEKRRNLCQFLRFLAYSFGANLMMYSSRMEQFPKLVKNMTSHFAFGTVCPQGYMTDHNKPMFVKCGFDSLESIGMPPGAENVMGASSPFNLWRESFIGIYPQKTSALDSDEVKKQDPMTDETFKEPNIDNLVEIKRKELENHIRQKRDREAAEARAADRISKINLR
ncbi:unnamed protein product [Caenorhabditis sp. 36 PRJEB53466]|nr:unnamed protein product [Caenorhabditis sp. 36 PRJEB53466]